MMIPFLTAPAIEETVMAEVWEPTKSTMSRGSQAAAIRVRKRETGTLRGCGTVVLSSRHFQAVES